jgi:putative transposase
VFDNKKGKAGARTIKMELDSIMNLKKIRRIMKKYGLACKIRRVNKARVSLKKNKENIFVGNMLNRGFKQHIPYRYASTDITYIKHQNQFSFLSVIKDLATGEVLTWRLSKFMNLDLVLNTINDLEKYFKKNNLALTKLLLHSDQGFQYTNLLYHNKLKELGITQSMSRKGNSVDNAPIESFFGHMKDEVEYSKLNFSLLKNLISEYMLEYNYKRKQWGRKKLAPVYYRDYLLNFAV